MICDANDKDITNVKIKLLPRGILTINFQSCVDPLLEIQFLLPTQRLLVACLHLNLKIIIYSNIIVVHDWSTRFHDLGSLFNNNGSTLCQGTSKIYIKS